ncbi:uncharacterized protein isoform X3 [Musca autumnalis]|uniref:uncharacterized protein isoform X3 n=1 Tax=Musca autumnalis TaxID=221902 RepID=UPI003CE8C55A
MLPPPLATSPQTPTTTMRITTTTTPITDRRNESAFVYNPADTTASRITSKATTTTIDGPTQRLKAMLNKTLSSHKHNNTAANNGDYSAQYFGSPVLASDDTPHVSPTQLETYADDEFVYGRINDGSGLVGNGSSFDSYATAVAAADMAVTTLTNGTHLEAATTTAATTTTAAAAAAAFPTAQTVATFIAAGNKNRATTIIVYPTDYRSTRAISLRPERSLSQGFTSLELDTVVEERCSDVEQTQTEILHPESPMESSTSYKMSLSSS